MKTKKLFSWFRNIALAEGVSFLLLLGVAMPLKYLAGFPLAVTIMGAIHGLLFVTFLVLGFELRADLKKPFSWLIKAFLASILPFGTFIMDKQWKKEQAALS